MIGTINEGGSGTLDTQSADTLAGIKVAAAYANDYLGGIAGHPIKVVSCGNKATPAGAIDCANQMVDQKINLYTDPYSGEEASIVPILTKAGIPTILASSSSQQGLTTPGSFALTGGYPASLGAFAIDAKQRGFKKVAMIVIDVPSATGAAQQLGGLAFKTEGVGYQVVPVAPGTADMTPQLQSAISSGADALAVTGDVSFCTTFLKGYQTLSLTVPKYLISTCVAPTVVSAAGSAMAGSYVATDRVQSPEDAVYVASVKKYGSSSTSTDPSSPVADGWSDMMAVVNAFKGYSGPVDNASLMAAMKAAKDVPIPLSGGLTYTCDGKALAILPSVCSMQVQIGTVDAKGIISNLKKIDAAAAFAAG